VCRIDAGTLASEVVRDSGSPFSSGWVEVRRTVVIAEDGTELPVFLAGRGLDDDRPRATWLHAHGGHGALHLPRFGAGPATWIELGGVYAHALIRGDGAYGEAWHEAGRRDRKMTTFEDALAVADWLVASGLTKPARLGITGHGHGGLVAGVAITRRPELFGAAAAHSGIFDMLRLHVMGGYRKFANPEFGSAGLDTDFPAIAAYTPLQHVREETAYPAVYLAVGEGDALIDANITQRDAAPPAHSYKFAAMLQHASSSGRPVLLRTLSGSGPMGMTGEALGRYEVEMLTFLARELGLEGADQP
jgi:prolyl oligopeptidase